MADGRIVVDIGEKRKRQFKSELYLTGQTITDWLKRAIDKFIKESEVK